MLLNACKDVGLAVNAVKTKYMEIGQTETCLHYTTRYKGIIDVWEQKKSRTFNDMLRPVVINGLEMGEDTTLYTKMKIKF